MDEIEDDDSYKLYYLHDIVEQGNIIALRSQFLTSNASTIQNISHQYTFKGNTMALETCLLEKDDMGCLPLHIAIIHQHTEKLKQINYLMDINISLKLAF